MRIVLSILAIIMCPGILLACEFQDDSECLSVAIKHDDGGKTSERHALTLINALAAEGCESLSYTESKSVQPHLLFDPTPVSIVREQWPDYRLIARAKTLNNELTVKGAILIQASRGIKDLSSLKGEWVSFVGKTSWPGYHLPLKLLNKAGINKETNHFYFAESHVGSVSALLHRDVLISVAAEPLAQRWAKSNGLSIIAVTDEVETGGWWVHSSVPSARAKSCANALTKIGSSKLKALPAWIGGFKVAF